MDEDLGLAELLGQLDCATAPGDRLVGVPGQHGELGQVAVGHGQFRSGRRPSSRATASRPARSASALRPSNQASRDSQRSVSPSLRRSRRARQQSSARSATRLPGRVGRSVALVGMAFQQLGQLGRGQSVGEPQSPRVLGGRLPVGAERGGPAGGDRGVCEHGRAAPAPSAWWASRAGSGAAPGRVRSAARARPCSSARRPGASARSTARRASSWRKPTPPPARPGASRRPRTRPHGRARHRPPRPAARTRAAGPPPRRVQDLPGR